MECGALSRSGKSLIVIGRGYHRWLTRRAANVADYESNNPVPARCAAP
jgi:cobyric acid synthase